MGYHQTIEYFPVLQKYLQFQYGSLQNQFIGMSYDSASYRNLSSRFNFQQKQQ
jgi:hypothetical protein